MFRIAPAVPLLFAAVLGACMMPQNSRPLDAGPAGSCGAENLQWLVARRESALAAVSLPAGTRTLRPGDMRTMDHRPDRLNIQLDEEGRITRVFCG